MRTVRLASRSCARRFDRISQATILAECRPQRKFGANWLGGRFTLAELSAILVLFALLTPFAAPTTVLVFLWGIASFALAPPLQVRAGRRAVAQHPSSEVPQPGPNGKWM